MKRYLAYSNSKRGFTLIEMLVVIAILGILGSLVLAGISSARKHAMAQRTGAMIELLSMAIERYSNDKNDYPPSQENDGLAGSEFLLEALLSDEGEGPYIGTKDVNMKDTDGNGIKEICDAWYRPIYYLHNRDYGRGEPNPRTFRLFSAGADGQLDPYNPASDDLRNWKFEGP